MRKKVLILSMMGCLLSSVVTAAPSVSNVTAPSSAALYDKFEVTFDVSTVATNLYWPYDPHPSCNTAAHPDAVPVGVGVTVEGLFTDDNWATTIVQPGFYCQSYRETDLQGNTHTLNSGRSWIVPVGDPQWKIRFAPNQTGNWKFKIRVTDAAGTTRTSEHGFACVSGSNHGFVRVSPNDRRYFELSDGTYMPFVGLAAAAGDIQGFEAEYSKLHSMGINLVRTWWQSSNPTLALFGAGGQGGDQNWVGLECSSEVVRSGRLVSAKIVSGGGISTEVSCEPNKQYRYRVTVKTVGLSGTGSYGFRLGLFPTSTGEQRSEHLVGDNDWTDVSMDFTTGPSQWGISYVVATVDNVTSGAAYLSDASLREVLAGGQLGPELLTRTDFQAHTSYPQSIAWVIDRQLDIAQTNGVFLRAVIEEKDDSFFSRIQADGTWGSFSNDNVYANATHACRTYQTYFWRYLVARYGYSPALHSVEFVNEGDPFNDNHIDAVVALADFFQLNDPNHHLVGTSNWHSFPPAMWKSSAIGCADLHMYLGYAVASGGKRIWPGWDGTWWQPNNDTTLGSGFEFDESVFHTGRRSLKMTIPKGVEPHQGDTTPHYSSIYFQCGCKAGDSLRISVWVKANNYVRPENPQLWNETQIPTYFCSNGGESAIGDHNNLLVPAGTYDWQQLVVTVTAPALANILTVQQPVYYGTYGTGSAEVWLDDLVVEDLTTGEIINYNGGFEEIEPESFDVVAGHCAYSRLCKSFQFDKPTIRGETGFSYPLRFTNPYKGIPFGGEDQLLVDDSNAVWWRKWIWSNLDSGGLMEIYWFSQLPLARGYLHGKAYQTFMSDIPLANGHYVDAKAVVSDPTIRVLGQRDTVNNRAHLWIDNSKYTWKNVVDNVTIPAVSGTITIPGLADGAYKVDWWDTTTGQVIRSEQVTSSNGSLTVSVTNLQSDIACKIYPAPANISLRIIVPSTNVIPGQVVTVTVEYTNVGESEAHSAQVSARVPALMDYVTMSAEASGGVYDATSKTITWTVDTVAAGETGTRTFQARVQ